MSAYSAQRILLTIAISAGLFLLSSLASLRYLKKVTVSELLKEEAAERSEKLRRGMKNDGRESVFPEDGATVDFAGRGTRPRTITAERRTEVSL